MFLFEYISSHNPTVFKAKLEEEGVSKVFAFGSSLELRNPNDVDLLIEMDTEDPIEKGEALIRLWDFFETYFQKKVDLLTPNSIQNPILLKEIEESKRLIYAKGQAEIFA
jgi:predicted nucleotidyltransferase